MARLYRQVDIVLQNHTNELLTLEGAAHLQGVWGTPEPIIGSVVTPQGARKWQSLSNSVGVSAEGSLRFGSTKGYINIVWNLPMDASDPHFSVTQPVTLQGKYVIRGANADFRIMVVTLTDRK